MSLFTRSTVNGKIEEKKKPVAALPKPKDVDKDEDSYNDEEDDEEVYITKKEHDKYNRLEITIETLDGKLKAQNELIADLKAQIESMRKENSSSTQFLQSIVVKLIEKPATLTAGQQYLADKAASTSVDSASGPKGKLP